MLLFQPVAGFRKIKNHRDDNSKTAQIVNNVQKRPVAQVKRAPLENPFRGKKWRRPFAFDVFLTLRPWLGPGLSQMQSHKASWDEEFRDAILLQFRTNSLGQSCRAP